MELREELERDVYEFHSYLLEATVYAEVAIRIHPKYFHELMLDEIARMRISVVTHDNPQLSHYTYVGIPLFIDLEVPLWIDREVDKWVIEEL